MLGFYLLPTFITVAPPTPFSLICPPFSALTMLAEFAMLIDALLAVFRKLFPFAPMKLTVPGTTLP